MIAYSDNQQQAIDKLNKLKVGALFMRPGTGKTRVSLALVNSSDCDYCLFIVPFSTKGNLTNEINKWGINCQYDIVGVESLSNSDRIYLETLDKLNHSSEAFIVVDESLKIKNTTARRTKRVLKFADYATYRLVLNGTPVSKNLLDLWPQMEFLSPKILKMNQDQFKDTFCHYIQYRKYKPDGKLGKWQEFIKNYENLEYLYSLIKPYVFDSDLQLNSNKQYVNIDYSIVANREEYMGLRNNLIASLEYGDADSFIKATQAMQHVYCAEPNKLRIIDKLIDDKTIIFTKFIRSQEAVLNKFPQAHVLTYGKGSFGLNLQQYNKIIFFDKTFDYAQRDQAEHRIYRMGQQEDVTYYDLTGDVNLEHTIDQNIDYKQNLLTEFKKLLNKGDEADWQKII